MNKKLNIVEEKEILVAEAVGKGHPDKICDQISDYILDACLKVDPESRVACEVMAANRLIIVSGEITTKANINVENEVWKVIKPLGYDENSFTIICNINKQSEDISRKVNKAELTYGAGDQGITYGYATNETSVYLPIQFVIANEILVQIEDCRKSNFIEKIKSDMKSLVEIYKFKNEITINKIVLAIQHEQFSSVREKNKWVNEIKQLVYDVLDSYHLTIKSSDIRINASGDFITGGPVGDTGLTGRKLQVDTYGGVAKHGGGAFSGKDYTKVDRTGAYLARWIAKNVVYNKLASQCEIGLIWEIGKEYPDDIIIDCFNTNNISKKEIKSIILKNFNELNLTKNIEALMLKKPNYHFTSVYGHFGNSKLPWEKLFKFK